jgi:glycosyltransferase involved in cell wall biosynthesis
MTDSLSARNNMVLFHRDFRRFTGGHLKVWDYFNHVAASNSHEPRIAFTPESKWDETNPWARARDRVIDWQPQAADLLFLAGNDWQCLPAEQGQSFSRPVINLVQHPRHADPNGELYRFLSNRAIRICVSAQVADAIKGTGKVKGPVFVISNGIDLAAIPDVKPHEHRPIQLLLCGLKAPDLARSLGESLANDNVTVNSLGQWIPRPEYLNRLNDAKIAVMLPRKEEGFYLPALEAMACEAIVVCPDCIGNRDFCRDGVNCFRPAYDEHEIAAAIKTAIRQSADETAAMLRNAKRTVSEHSLEQERENFLKILARVDELWEA